MNTVIRLYHFINILSIDIVAGAIVSSLFFAKIFGVHIRPYGLLALGLTVWIIYTIDHLRDAKKIRHQASTKRHRFHQQHFRALLVLLSLALVWDAYAIFFIRRQVLEWGIILWLVVALYLIIQRSLRFLKEIFIAFLYTCGVLLLSVSITKVPLTITHYLLIAQFGLIAWINLVMFSWFDQVYDQQDKQNSFVTILGKRTTRSFLYFFLGCSFLISIILIYTQGLSVPVLVQLLMNIVLFFIFLFRNVLAKNDLYRLLGDAIFFFPVIYIV